MKLEPGTLLLHYRLVDKVGEGGMGVVWRAVDTTLDRQVAIKVLPDVFVNDPDRSARFDREARLLASLNHPNITTVHAAHHVDGVRFLVMEFAHGESLAGRITRGRIPLDDALVIAKQIALAIEAAHESGIVHRDLKPANITVTGDNKVEVLDFGLAKALDPAGTMSGSDLSKSPTMAAGHTSAGLILGTAAYMSPEQARGKSVDRRTDIWAFGCVLYEMLTGRRAFDGETVTDVLAAVVTRDPDWSLVPGDTPARIRELLRRCVEKDPQRRLRDAGEIRIAIEDVIARPHSDMTPMTAVAGAPQRRRRRVWPWLVLAGMATLIVLEAIDRDDAPDVATHLSVVLPPADMLDGGSENLLLNVSRDGRTIAYGARNEGGQQLFVRRIGEPEPAVVPGTIGGHAPFFSPDGQWIAFIADTKLKKVSVNGGPVFDICDVSADRAGVWLDDGSIIVVTHATMPLMRVSSSGGVPEAVTVIDSTRGERTHRWPDVLPGGEWVIFTIGSVNSPGSYEAATIAATNLRTGEKRELLKGASMARYCEPGYLVFSRNGMLLAAPIDPDDPGISGPSVPVFDHIDREPSSGAVHFALSRTGTLVYAPTIEGAGVAELVWVGLDGSISPIPAPEREYHLPRISPDGKQVLVTIGPGYGTGDMWKLDLARQTLARLTFDDKTIVGYWLPDQKGIVYQNEETAFNIHTLVLGGDAAPKSIHHKSTPIMLSGVTPDGRWVLFSPWGAAEADVFMLPVAGGEPQLVVSESLDQSDGSVSPDGQWIAYSTRHSGISEVFVRAFPAGTSKWQVSTGGGVMPVWSPNRSEVYWLSGGAMYAANFETGARSISFGSPRRLFALPLGRGIEADLRPYDIAPDGTRFLMTRIARPELARRRIDVVLDFRARLKSLEKKGVTQ